MRSCDKCNYLIINPTGNKEFFFHEVSCPNNNPDKTPEIIKNDQGESSKRIPKTKIRAK